MRGTDKAAPRLRASSATSPVVSNRSGDVTGFYVGRTRLEGDTRTVDKRVRGYRPAKKPLQHALFGLHKTVRGEPLSADEARRWAEVMRREFRGR